MSPAIKDVLLNKKYVVSIILIISILIILSGYFFYSYQKTEIDRDKHETIAAIAELKIKQINEWYTDQINDAEIISQNIYFVSLLGDLKNNFSAKNHSLLKRYLTELKKEHNFKDIIIASPGGKLIFRDDSANLRIEPVEKQFIKKVSENDTTLCTDLFRSAFDDSHILIDFISPVLNTNGNQIAVIIFRLNPDSFLYPLIQNWPTPSHTAETKLFRREDGHIIFLNELRHENNTALLMRTPLTEIDDPAVQTALGRTGIFEGIDYRGEKVLAYLAGIPGTPWFMVAKIDQREIYAELYKSIIFIMILVVILILLLAAVAAWLYSNNQRNIYRKLYEAHEQYKITLYSIGDAVITTDKKGKIKYLNPVAEKLTGWTERQASGKKLHEVFKIINELTREKVESPVEKVLTEGLIVGLANHTLLISKDGKETPIADSGAPIKTDKGEITGVVLVFRDQTKERVYRDTLQKNEERYRSLFNSIRDAIIVTDTNRNIVSCNPAFTEMFGYTFDEIKGKKTIYIHENEKIYEEMGKKIKEHFGDKQFLYNSGYRRKNGSLFPGETAVYYLKDAKKNTEGFIGLIRDISEKLEAENILKESEKKYRDFFMKDITGDFLTTTDGRIIDSNPAFLKMMGFSSLDELKNYSIINFYKNPSDRKKLLNIIKSHKEVNNFELTLLRKNGSEMSVIENVIGVFDNDGNLKQLRGYLFDITDRKIAEQKLIEAKEKAERADKLKSEFLAQMSHEIRSPLNSVLSFTGLIKKETENIQSDDLEISFNGINSASKRIIRTIDSILNMSELQLGTYQVVKRKIDLLEILNNLMKEYDNSAKAKNIELKLKENQIERAELETDDYAVGQILANLIDNAIKYTNKGKIEINILKNGGDIWTVDVEDTGIGISREYISHLFESFSQEDQGYTRKYEGSGLGMALVKRYCELINAEITVESTKNVGSKFTVQLGNL